MAQAEARVGMVDEAAEVVAKAPENLLLEWKDNN